MRERANGPQAQRFSRKVALAGSDKKIRLLGHWGSKVFFRNVVIKSVGSEG
jgi:hypothetical protein